MLRETILLDRDNITSFVLIQNKVVKIDLTAVTKVQLIIGSTTIDSDSISNTLLNWNTTLNYRDKTPEAIKMKIGAMTLSPALSPGVVSDCKLITFDADNALGIVWADDIEITII